MISPRFWKFGLYVVFFSYVLQDSDALSLNTPPIVLLNAATTLTWSSTPTDPPAFNLEFNCGLLGSASIGQPETADGHFSVPPGLIPAFIKAALRLAGLCTIRATSTIDGAILSATGTLTLSAGLPTTTPVRAPPTSAPIPPPPNSPSPPPPPPPPPPTSNPTIPSTPASPSNDIPVTTLTQMSGALVTLTLSGQSQSVTVVNSFVSASGSQANSKQVFHSGTTTLAPSESGGNVAPVITSTSATTSTDSASATPTKAPSSPKPLGAIVGGAVAGVVAVSAAVLLLVVLRHRSLKKSDSDSDTQYLQHSTPGRSMGAMEDDEWFGPPPGVTEESQTEFFMHPPPPVNMTQHMAMYDMTVYNPTPISHPYSYEYDTHPDHTSNQSRHQRRSQNTDSTGSASAVPFGRYWISDDVYV